MPQEQEVAVARRHAIGSLAALAAGLASSVAAVGPARAGLFGDDNAEIQAQYATRTVGEIEPRLGYIPQRSGGLRDTSASPNFQLQPQQLQQLEGAVIDIHMSTCLHGHPHMDDSSVNCHMATVCLCMYVMPCASGLNLKEALHLTGLAGFVAFLAADHSCATLQGLRFAHC